MKRMTMAVATMLVAALTAGYAQGKVKLKYFVYGPETFGKFHDAVQKGFEAANPNVAVELVNPTGDPNQKLLAMMSAGLTPDIFWIHSSQFARLASANMLTELTPYIKRDNIKLDDFIQAALKPLTYKGRLYGLPWAAHMNVNYFNPDLFAAAGVPPPKSDWSWDDYLQTVKRLTRDTNGDNKPDVLGASVDFWYGRLHPWVQQAGTDWFDDEGTKSNLGSSEAIEAIKWVKELKDKHQAVSLNQGLSPSYDMGCSTAATPYLLLTHWFVINFFVHGSSS